MLLLLVAFFAYIVYYIIDFYRNVAKYPKGPTPLPFIGNMHQLTQGEFFRDFERLREEYGAVFTVFMPEAVFVLADHESVTEAMTARGDDFSDRPTNIANQMVMLEFCTPYMEYNGIEQGRKTEDLVERTIPFGLGKRQCAGEGLARVELFLGIAATLQRYRILPPVDGSGIDLEPRLLNIHLPKPHKLKIVPL